MEEYKNDVELKSPTLTKLENFWYHYKIHTIAGILIVIILSVILLQTCSRTGYDGYILYAGPHELKHNAGGSYVGAVSSLKRVCEDTDGDGAVNVSLLNLFVINDAEAEELISGDDSLEINSALVNEDAKTLHQSLLYGDYYVCFLSERLFLEYDGEFEGKLFAPLAPYFAEGREYELVNERGVYLSSLDFSSLPEIASLPKDTVVSLRALSEVSGVIGGGKSERSFAIGEDIIRRIFAYE